MAGCLMVGDWAQQLPSFSRSGCGAPHPSRAAHNIRYGCWSCKSALAAQFVRSNGSTGRVGVGLVRHDDGPAAQARPLRPNRQERPAPHDVQHAGEVIGEDMERPLGRDARQRLPEKCVAPCGLSSWQDQYRPPLPPRIPRRCRTARLRDGPGHRPGSTDWGGPAETKTVLPLDPRELGRAVT